MAESSKVTLLLKRMGENDRAAADSLFPLLYKELRALADGQHRSERPDAAMVSGIRPPRVRLRLHHRATDMRRPSAGLLDARWAVPIRAARWSRSSAGAPGQLNAALVDAGAIDVLLAGVAAGTPAPLAGPAPPSR